jgi:lipid II:glycine glycyltransferase (peptidoglycan interpeptide bridge formation enzyme)
MNLLVLEEPDAQWDQFVSGHSNLLFHTSTWWKVLKQGYGYPARYLVLERDGEWHCVLPGIIVGNRFFRVFYSLIPYGGFIGDRKYIPEFLTLLGQWAKREKIHRFQIVDPSIKEPKELPDFNCVESFRHILDLKDKSAEQIWDGYEQSLQRNIKKAMKSDLVFEAAKNRQEVEQFYGLYLASMKRNKALAKYPLELFYGIFDVLVPEHADLLFVKHQNQPIAGVVMIYSEDTAHYFHGGSATEHLDLRPNDLLFHRAIQLASEKGKSYFDFFGSDKRFASLIRFKDKWGTRREDLFSFHKDLGLLRPAVFKMGLKLAQTHLGSALHRAIKSTRKEKSE